MKLADLQKLYEKYKQKYGDTAYQHVSELMEEAKEIHRQGWLKKPTKKRDFEQSWKGVKGNILEKFIILIIENEVDKVGLKIVKCKTLEQLNLTWKLSKIKRAVCVDYGGEYGFHVPDADIIIYDLKSLQVIAILAIHKERIAQTGYWRFKLSQDAVTKHIKVFFITPDEDENLGYEKYGNKGRLVEVDAKEINLKEMFKDIQLN